MVHALDHRDNHQDAAATRTRTCSLKTASNWSTTCSRMPASTRGRIAHRGQRPPDDGVLAEVEFHPNDGGDNVAGDNGLAEGSLHTDNGVLAECGFCPDDSRHNVANNDVTSYSQTMAAAYSRTAACSRPVACLRKPASRAATSRTATTTLAHSHRATTSSATTTTCARSPTRYVRWSACCTAAPAGQRGTQVQLGNALMTWYCSCCNQFFLLRFN